MKNDGTIRDATAGLSRNENVSIGIPELENLPYGNITLALLKLREKTSGLTREEESALTAVGALAFLQSCNHRTWRDPIFNKYHEICDAYVQPDQSYAFWRTLGEKFPLELDLHKRMLWGVGFENVTSHMLTVAARALSLGQLLLPEETQSELATAAMLHDVFKAEEVSMRKNGKSEDEIGAAFKNFLVEEGYSEWIIKLVNSVGHTSIPEIREIVVMHRPRDPREIAQLILHYVDSITIDADPLKGPHIDEYGRVVSDIRARTSRNTVRYAKIDEEWIDRVGLGTFELQANLAMQIERIIKGKLSHPDAEVHRSGLIVDGSIAEWVQKDTNRAIANTYPSYGTSYALGGTARSIDDAVESLKIIDEL